LQDAADRSQDRVQNECVKLVVLLKRLKNCGNSNVVHKGKGKRKRKRKVHRITGHEGPDGDWRYSSTLFLTSALDWGGGVFNATPRPLYPPGKTRYPLYSRLSGPQGRSGRVRNNQRGNIFCFNANANHMLGATINNIVAIATSHLRFVYP